MSDILSENLNIFTVGPSHYRFAKDRIVDWKIVLADNSCREVLNNESGGTICDFNVRALPIVGLPDIDTQNVALKKSNITSHSVTFELDDIDLCRICFPRIKYTFSDLSFKLEMELNNISTFPIYWCPIIRFQLHLPWHKTLSLDQYAIYSKSKKKLILNNEYTVLESGKCPERVQLVNMDSGNIIAITNIQDPKITITTKNEEELLYVTLGGKYPNACLGLHKTDTEYCTELLCMLDLPNSDDSTDFSHYKCVASKQVSNFVIELSVC